MARAMDKAPKDTWDKPVPNHAVPPEHQAHSQAGGAQGYHHAAHKSPSTRKGVGKHFPITLMTHPPCAYVKRLAYGIRPWACICPAPFMEEMAGCLAVHIVVGRPVEHDPLCR